MAAHRIRLGPPWEATTADDGRTRHLRRFGRPRTHAPGERVWLICESVPSLATVTVNGVTLGSATPAPAFAADITDVLQPRNSLIIETASADPLGPVALEIRA